MLFGFILGGLLGGRVLSGGMGWDRLANALGGMGLGLLGAIFFALFFISRLSFRARILSGMGFLLGAALLFLIFGNF